MQFEWDETKRRTNREKHGIDFIDAIMVFSDVRAICALSRFAGAEQRFVQIGDVGGRLIAVVFTARGDVTRLISARAARDQERLRYGQRQHHNGSSNAD